MSDKDTVGQLVVGNSDPIDIQGIDVATGSDLDLGKGRTQMPGVRLWGHRINLSGEDGISCEECDMEEAVPNLLQQSSGFREVVYRLYILGKFKNTQCQSEYETDNSSLHTSTANIQTSGVQKFDVDDGYVVADSGVIIESTSSNYTKGDMLTDKQWMELVHNAQPAASIDDLSDSISDMSDSIGDAHMSMGDMTMMVDESMQEALKDEVTMGTGTSSSTKSSVQMDEDVDESTREKFARKLCERVGIR